MVHHFRPSLGTSIKTGFAQEGDYVNDVLQIARSDLNYEFAPNWNFHWAVSYREAEQNFDHFYLGGLCAHGKYRDCKCGFM